MIDETTYNNMRESLQFIIALGFDYDGLHTAKDLKGLIDDIVALARDALDGKDPLQKMA